MFVRIAGKVLSLLGLILAVLGTFLVIRGALFSTRQIEVEPVKIELTDFRRAVRNLARSIRFPTLSHQDPRQFNGRPFLELHDYLEKAYPRTHGTLTKEVIAEFSLLYTWRGQDAGSKPVLLMAHLDVVPVEPGTESAWTHPAFAGKITKRYIWGRGAMDDKVGLMGTLEAVEWLLEQGFQPRRTIYLAFGHDEEIGGSAGAATIAAHLASAGVQLDFVLDEGMPIGKGLLPGVAAPVAMVGIAEKGYLTLELAVDGKSGHASMPPPHTAVGILSTAIHRLERSPLPGSIEGPLALMLDYAGPEMDFLRRVIFGNLWLFGGMVEDQLAGKPTTNALLRTTTAVTMIQGGNKENVLPAKATAVVNFRIRPGDTIAGVIEHVRAAIGDPRVAILSRPDFSTEPSPVAEIDSESYRTIEKTIRQIFPKTVVAPALLVAATDSRHYIPLADNVYRFLPQRLSPKDIARIHGIDERISVRNYKEIVKFYIQLIRNAAG